jgi:hypothetical protein
MSPDERKDIRVESEGTATSESDFQLYEGRHGVHFGCLSLLPQEFLETPDLTNAESEQFVSPGVRQPRATVIIQGVVMRRSRPAEGQ